MIPTAARVGARVHCRLFGREDKEGRSRAQRDFKEIQITSTKKFQENVEAQHKKEWQNFEASSKYRTMSFTNKCFRTEDKVNKAMFDLNEEEEKYSKINSKIGRREQVGIKALRLRPNIIQSMRPSKKN